MSTRPSLCLNMIVKDEIENLPRLFRSVMPYITHWAICDTGSTDGTQDYIWATLKHLPGALRQDEWENFGANRQKALELGREVGADYMLWMDADEELIVEDENWCNQLTLDAYSIRVNKGSMSWASARINNLHSPWMWRGVLHEALFATGPVKTGKLEGVWVASHLGGARSRQPDQAENEVKLLEAGVREEPDNERYWFYLGLCYKGVGKLDEAIHALEKRVSMGRWHEEVWWATFELAGLYWLKNDAPGAIMRYLECYNMEPRRAEPLHYMADLFATWHKPNIAQLLYEAAMSKEKPNLLLFVAEPVYDYLAKLGYAWCLVANNYLADAIAVFTEVLEFPHLPPEKREEVEKLKEATHLHLAEQVSRAIFPQSEEPSDEGNDGKVLTMVSE